MLRFELRHRRNRIGLGGENESIGSAYAVSTLDRRLTLTCP